MRRTYKYRLYPKREQLIALERQLSEARSLYNAAIQERREAWRMQKIRLNYFDQANQLKEIRDAGNLDLANFSACQDVLRRVDKTFKAFFRRIKAGEKSGYPRFKSRDRFNSYTFPVWGDGCHLTELSRLKVQGAGVIKLKMHRPIVGDIKTLTLKCDAGKWYACFSAVIDVPDFTPSLDSIGIDVGLYSFAALSNGELVANPRTLKTGLGELRRCQRKVARRKRGSTNRRKAVRLLQKAHTRIRNRRSDFQHKLSRQLADNYGLIAVEDLNIKGLSRGMLARSVNDAAWGSFLAKLAYKVEYTGGQLVRVNPNGTSQVCSRCGCLPDVSKTLADRIHSCSCGLVIDRDVNAARNILRLGLSLATGTWHSSAGVVAEAVCFS
ncbi:MAG: transposase [Bacteroidales bacterium]|nr:transposase [Bacteroidales bacterium]